ncbi:outer membrane beta-barrel protein, partial [Opacimonas viscosa]
YTTLGFVAKRESIDSSLEQTGGFLRTTYGASVKHELSELVKIKADLGYGTDELVFSAARKDERLAAQTSIEYSVL